MTTASTTKMTASQYFMLGEDPPGLRLELVDGRIVNSTGPITASQYLMLGEDPPGVRLELVNGEIVVSPSPSSHHSYIDTMLRYILTGYIKQHDLGIILGDVDTIFSKLNVRRPDILFVAKSRLHLIKGHGIPIAPDLCVEILSPSSATTDQTEKMDLYARSGVPHYWIIDPKGRTFEAYELTDKQYIRQSFGRDKDVVKAAPFPACEIPLAELWSPLE
ncbi:MAG: Uma2 family endonuclease [Phycisphaerales bacterium]|nr:Uma2 family endonuclease [Phycisphaerales bacterium]